MTVIGNVTREPELRYTQGGQAVTGLSIAVNRKWKQNDEWKEQTSFFEVVCWGTLGENVATCIAKGTRVIVSGRLEQSSWESKEGEKRSKVEITADSLGPDLRWATAQIERNVREERV